MLEEKFKRALEKLKKSEDQRETKRNFDQTLDLIINLRNFDVRRESFNLFITLPNIIKEKKVLGFFEKDSNILDTLKKEEFGNYKEKKDMRKLLKRYDFFISNAKLMPSVATHFGRTLGPAGKMPSPQLGIVPTEDEKTVKNLISKINSTVRVRVKEPSIKAGVAKESLEIDKILENILTAYNKIVESLPKKQENIRDVKLKFTMAKPVKVEI